MHVVFVFCPNGQSLLFVVLLLLLLLSLLLSFLTFYVIGSEIISDKIILYCPVNGNLLRSIPSA